MTRTVLTEALRTEQFWTIQDGGLDALRQADANSSAPVPDTAQAHETALRAGAEYLSRSDQRQAMPGGKVVAVVNFCGTIVSRSPLWAASYGYLNPQAFAAEMIALADDPNVGAIVINMDSNGGTVTGTYEAAEAVAYAARAKPGKVFAVANDMALSGGMWIAAQASEVIAAPNAMLGSIGCIMSHTDLSGYYGTLGVIFSYIRSAPKKALGQPTETLSPEARAERQKMVDAIHQNFTLAISKGRGISRDAAAQLATGEIWIGAEAVAAGLADRVGTVSDIMGELTGRTVAAPVSNGGGDYEDDLDAAAAPLATPPNPAKPGTPSPTPAGLSHNGAAPPVTLPTAPQKSGPEAKTMNLKDIQAKWNSGATLTAEETAFLRAALDSPTPAASVDVSGLPPEVATALKDAQARAATAEANAAKAEGSLALELDAKESAKFEARAESLGQPKAFGAVLRAAHGSLSGLPDGAAQIAALEAAISAKAAQESLTGEIGSTKGGPATPHAKGTGAHANVQDEYRARVQDELTADTKLTRVQAGEVVFKKDPEFARRYANGR